ncbi:hypothetical protein pEaSNUABM37_00008 [Erwinia phage pEa_SNUABM_37]|nr:hypothetical protein pEaSNUABM37_00008 [Erwinia phage pEa_SNUABM_37]QXO10478.1 hypothetical protein pEaSNUABM48_00008 [Erwinia phage pEa_SNUABM_48]
MNLDYTIYEQDNKQFARTVILHSTRTAEAINLKMAMLGYSYLQQDKRTWKYYMNLAGVYHGSNKPMQVRSLDNGELIDFTAENMRIHVSTARSYQYGTDYYKELLAKFPDQQMLIRGILNPIPYEVSTTAKEYQIIWYESDLILEGEDNVLPQLQNWIYTYVKQTEHQNYTNLTDNLMHPYFFGIIEMHLATRLMMIRFENIGTNYVHDFHIWAHLGSHAGLQRYKPYLTRKQVLWLYRNIVWLTRNPGKRYQFDRIMDNLLTERSIPIAAYNAQHSTVSLLEDVKAGVRFKRELLNMQDKISDDAYFRTTREILEDQVPLARDNIDVYEDAIPATTLSVRANRNAQLPTKVLESTMRDLSESVAFPLSNTILNEWARMSSEGRYTAMVSMVNPKTGLTMNMSVKDAFVLYLYAVWQGQGQPLEFVPRYQATMCMKIPRPTFAQLKERHGSKNVTDAWILQALTNQPDLPAIISTETFYKKMVEINDATQLHRDLWTYRNWHMERAEIELMVFDLYEDVTCDFNSGTKYEDWFSIRGWDLTDIQPEDWTTIAVNLMTTATGMDTTDQQRMADVQKAMLELTLELSSYTIQVIRKINDQAIVQLDYPTLRLGEVHMRTGQTHHTNTNVRIIKAPMKRKSTVDMVSKSNIIASHGSSRRRWVYDLCTAVGASAVGRPKTRFYADGATARIRDEDKIIEPIVRTTLLDGLWPTPFEDTRPVIEQDQVLDGLWTEPKAVGNQLLDGLWQQPIAVGSQMLDGLWGATYNVDEQLLNGLAHDDLQVNLELLNGLYANTLPKVVSFTPSDIDDETKNSLDAQQWDGE